MNNEPDVCFQIVDDNLDLQYLIQLKLSEDPRLKFGGAATNIIEAIKLMRVTHCQILILDHFIEGEVMGLQAAPIIKAANPEIKIILFSSQDLIKEANAEPAIDLYLEKRDLNKLLPAALRLLGMDAEEE